MKPKIKVTLLLQLPHPNRLNGDKKYYTKEVKPTGKWKTVWTNNDCVLFVEITLTRKVKKKVGETKPFKGILKDFFVKSIFDMVDEEHAYFAHENTLTLVVDIENTCTKCEEVKQPTDYEMWMEQQRKTSPA